MSVAPVPVCGRHFHAAAARIASTAKCTTRMMIAAISDPLGPTIDASIVVSTTSRTPAPPGKDDRNPATNASDIDAKLTA